MAEVMIPIEALTRTRGRRVRTEPTVALCVRVGESVVGRAKLRLLRDGGSLSGAVEDALAAWVDRPGVERSVVPPAVEVAA